MTSQQEWSTVLVLVSKVCEGLVACEVIFFAHSSNEQL